MGEISCSRAGSCVGNACNLAASREVISPSAITFGTSGISVTTSLEAHVTPFLFEDHSVSRLDSADARTKSVSGVGDEEIVMISRVGGDSRADLVAEKVAPSLGGDDLLDPVVRNVVSRSVVGTVEALSYSRADPVVRNVLFHDHVKQTIF